MDAEANDITLRDYQHEFILGAIAAIRSGRDALIEAPTGSGKTTIARVACRALLGAPMAGIAIGAPQSHIEHGFVSGVAQRVGWPDGGPPVSIPPGFVRRAVDGTTATGELAAYLSAPANPDVLTCTHAALARLGQDPGRLPADLRGRLLVLDEAHHHPAAGLSRLEREWKARGGRVLYLTATAYRADGRPVAAGAGVAVFRRTLDEHMDAGMAPRRLEHAVVPLGEPGDAVTAAEFVGDAIRNPALTSQVARAMAASWVADGKPKTIVRVPPTAGGAAPMVAAVVAAFRAAGARVYDATGVGAGTQRRFVALLEAERGRSFAASEVDVIVGSQRVIEGTDWPLDAAVYCYGVPGSIPMMVQFVGRATRAKGGDYPEAHRDVAMLRLFVAAAGGDVLDQLSSAQARHFLLLSMFLVDRRTFEPWVVTRAIREATGVRTAEAPAVDPGVRALIRLAMAEAAGGLETVTVGALVNAARARVPDAIEADLAAVAVELLAGGESGVGSGTGPDVVASLKRRVRASVRIGPDVADAYREAFAKVLAEFRDRVIAVPGSLRMLAVSVGSLSGGDMKRWAKRFGGREFTNAELLAAAIAFRDREGRWPTSKDKAIDPILGVSWNTVNRRKPEGLGLFGFLVKHGLRRPQIRCKPEKILAAAIAFRDREGRLPTCDDGTIDPILGVSWRAIDQRRPENLTLAKFFFKHGLRSYRGKFSPGEILAAAIAFRDREGRLPTRADMAHDPILGLSWGAIDGRMKREGVSLSQFLIKHGLRSPRKQRRVPA